MANWYGASRTNYFHCDDRAALETAIEPFDLQIMPGSYETLLMLAPSELSEGGWPIFAITEDDVEIEFSFEKIVMPHVKEGEVVITMSAGAEKLRYVTGQAQAFIRKGEEVRSCALSLNDIYAKAAARFETPLADITACEY